MSTYFRSKEILFRIISYYVSSDILLVTLMVVVWDYIMHLKLCVCTYYYYGYNCNNVSTKRSSMAQRTERSACERGS
jgi:hypothetical protein